MIKCILIDIDNTLLDFHKCAREAMCLAAKDWNIVFPKDYFEIFTEINDSLWEKIEKGELNRQGLFKIRWNMIFEVMGISADGEAFEELFRDYIKKSAIPVDGAEEILEYLSEKYYVCTASNSEFAQQEKRLRKAEMLPFIRKIFTSEEIGFAKPSSGFFEACKRELPQFEKDEIMVIGDSITADIDGANAFGFKTCWFNFNKEADAKCDCADFIVDELIQIKKFL
ncbi:MAG: noncanonical pyrimidine nucleotidase, YjjG family [Ruminococcaceae bacterium]|nr:noncanonical pyrimidine nucleotidase, YjjG family [Oscillospiraceae bacterium]